MILRLHNKSGLPVFIVGVTLTTSFNKYVAENHYWLNAQTDIIWAFVGHVLFVLTIPESIFQAEAQGVDLSVAAGYLGVVETVLTDAEPTSLDAAALLGILQLLKEVSDMDANEPEELATLEQLGQHYVAIAGAILEEQNAEEWSKIKPILDGPMTVVENMDKMVSSLHQLLSTERPKSPSGVRMLVSSSKALGCEGEEEPGELLKQI
ncbi:Hypothetical predicted protein [Podarcis lilfordi]|uniref:Uncharacterized protein n=1 Tax=Podarcis lilfordi TaxID=74358 RepID=A0AA35LPJ8_9SAUR|nr:Hypothetical predicted protein [Podarcis lilfordi]